VQHLVYLLSLDIQSPTRHPVSNSACMERLSSPASLGLVLLNARRTHLFLHPDPPSSSSVIRKVKRILINNRYDLSLFNFFYAGLNTVLETSCNVTAMYQSLLYLSRCVIEDLLLTKVMPSLYWVSFVRGENSLKGWF
jgi:hypothetical protein